MRYTIIFIVSIALQLTSIGQDAQTSPCYPIKYLDFFGLDKVEVVKWPQSEVSDMLKMNFDIEFEKSQVRTNFIIPTIVYQFKEYHPQCTTNIDTAYLNQIMELYNKIRGLDNTKFSDQSISKQIDFIRDDFYELAENNDFVI